jgi:purine nucleosidase
MYEESGESMDAHKIALTTLFLVLTGCSASAQQRRKVIVNEDFSGPGGSNMQTLLVLAQSPQVEVLGATVVSGDQWRDEEVDTRFACWKSSDARIFPWCRAPLFRWCGVATKRNCGRNATER